MDMPAGTQDRFLSAFSSRLSDARDEVEAVGIVHDMLEAHLGVACVIWSAESTDGVPLAQACRPLPIEAFGPLIGEALSRGETVILDDISADPRLSDPALVQALLDDGVMACVVAPLWLDGGLSVAVQAHVGHKRHWSELDVTLVTALAAITAEAVRRIQAERRLLDSEENFRLLAETLPIQAWVSAPDSRILWVNEQAAIYAGQTTEQLKQPDWERIVHPDDQIPSLNAWNTALQAGTPYEHEYRLRRWDGAYRWHLARALPFRDAAGVVTRWIGANTDIDDQRRAMADLAQLNATLESRVEARTRELREAEAALRQAQKMEAIGQLTGGIAHDFNNLLAGIIGSLDLMKRRIETGRLDDLERFMDAAIASANSAAALTQRLLAFARRQSLDNKPVDAAALIDSMAHLLRRTLGDQVRLELAAATDAWHAMTDANQLESALLNLAINARDAMPAGGRLTIGTYNRSVIEASREAHLGLAPGDYVAIFVADTGAGMDKEVMERAFEPFFTTKPIGQGTGLGLSMVFGYARQSGGLAHIASEPGQGTTVTLLLPRAEPASLTAPAMPVETPTGAGETVLIVEDVPAVRAFIAAVLQDLDYRIMQASEGAEAMPILDSGAAIDLLLTDVGLPGMNGRQLAEYARGRRPDLKILFVSGYAENVAARTSLLSAGMDIISKPFTVDALALKVNEMLRGESAG
jgi:PAS domain S-box-containing protein